MEATIKQTGPIPEEESVRIARKALEDAIAAGENVLTPLDSVCNTPPMHVVTIEKMIFSTDPAEQEMYVQEGDKKDPPEKKKYSPAKRALLMIAHAGNVQIRHEFSGRTDDRSDPNYMSWKIVGVRLNLDGSQSSWQGENDFEWNILEEQILEGKRKSSAYWKQDWWTKKSPKEKDEYIKRVGREDYLNFRRHGAARCETGALLRLIRGFFPLLKGVYSYEKLQKPFVVARLVFRPDYRDEYVRRQAIDLAFRTVQGIFGPQNMSALQPRQLPGSSIDMQPTDSGGYEMPEAERPESEPEPWPVQDNLQDNLQDNYRQADHPGKVQIIEDLIKRKGYSTAKLAKPVDEYSEEKLAPFFEHLLSLPDKPADDDIPL